jgi:hypothetical protein
VNSGAPSTDWFSLWKYRPIRAKQVDWEVDSEERYQTTRPKSGSSGGNALSPNVPSNSVAMCKDVQASLSPIRMLYI